jgi:hypothetical protein
MTIKPGRASGANTAERVPITMRAAPSRALRQAFSRSVSFSPECSTAIGVAKRERKRFNSCGVKPISGTSTSACSLRRSTSSIKCKYTSVLPLPVTP